MIYGIFHAGSGLGNQLHRYVATRVLALEKGYDWGMIAPKLFKGSSFMKLDMGKECPYPFTIEEGTGKVVPLAPIDSWEDMMVCYNPDFNFIPDNTIIDGNFEDERYFETHLDKIKEWLNTEEVKIEDNVCAIGFRGGEYYTVPELGVPKEYYDRAIDKIRKINPRTKFEVHTDDLEMAKNWFPNFKVFRDVEINWQTIRYAKNAIIANSSFYVLPRLLNGGLTIAPMYWNRYNTKKWEFPQNYYKSFQYI